MADSAFEVMCRTWQPVCLTRDLDSGKPLHYRLLGEELALARLPTGLLAVADACPHKGSSLSRGFVDGDLLRCPYHGWGFDSAGRCRSVPSLPACPESFLERATPRSFAIRERYGMVWVKLDPSAEADIPEVPEFEDPSWSYLVADPMPFACGFRREIENYLDMAHFAFAHSTTLGAAASALVPPLEITAVPGGFRMIAPFPALSGPGIRPGKLQSAHRRLQCCHLPNFTTIRQSFEGGDERVLVHIPSPNTPTSCTVFWALAISPGFDGPPPAQQMEFATRVLEEDRNMCENQRPLEVPLDPSGGAWGVAVNPADTLANTFQRHFRAFLREHAPGEAIEQDYGPPAD